mgnify:CR=1 FL=1
MMHTATYWIDKLKLTKHPEGGYFKEVYRSNEIVSKKGLPQRYNSFRSFSTSIYFLLKSGEFSAFHRLKSDEIWHFYEGVPLWIFILFPNGKLATVTLGQDPAKQQQFQVAIPKGAWFAAKPAEKGAFSLMGCTVAPGFDFDDFELARQEVLVKRYPQHEKIIRQLTIH